MYPRYVDNSLLTCRAKDETLSTLKIQAAFHKIETWTEENDMIFNPRKFEAIHFSQRTAFPNPEIKLALPTSANGLGALRVIKAIPKKAFMRWRRIYFDSRLPFSDHAEKLARERRKAALRLRMLVKTTRRIEVFTMQKAVHACILPILTYRAPAWWPGRLRINKQGLTIQNSIKEICFKLDKAQNVALCANLPVWKTIPTTILQKKAATPPIYHALNYLCKLAALRMHKLETQHPLHIITKVVDSSAQLSRLERLVLKCPKEVKWLDPLSGLQPWEGHLFRGLDGCLAVTGGTGDKIKAAERFNAWLQAQNSLDIIVYTDGLQVIKQNNTPIGIGSG